MKNKIIFHLDLDCFFCRCEEIVNPELQSIPFVIAHNKSNAIISTSNQHARKFGIKSAMSLYEARNLYPKIINVEPHFDLYQEKSNNFFNFIKNNYTNEIEILSIDECYIDVTNLLTNYHDNIDILAKDIINRLYEKTKLNVTIGIGNNKFLAKMAGDTKPKNKIAKIFIEDIKQKIWPLQINKVFGIGSKIQKVLNNLNIYTVNDFVNYKNQQQLKKILMKRYDYLFNCFTGQSNDQIHYEQNQPKSLSQSKTFDYFIEDKLELKKYLLFLTDELINIMETNELITKTIHISFRYENNEMKTKSKTYSEYLINKKILKEEFVKFFNKEWNNKPIILLGVSVSNLINKEQKTKQEKLF